MEETKENLIESLGDWIVKSNDFVFHISHVLFVHKTGNNIHLAFQGNNLNLVLPHEDAAIEYFKWLSDYKIKYDKAMTEEFVKKSILHQASVEIQNKMAGKLIDGCPHS